MRKAGFFTVALFLTHFSANGMERYWGSEDIEFFNKKSETYKKIIYVFNECKEACREELSIGELASISSIVLVVTGIDLYLLNKLLK